MIDYLQNEDLCSIGVKIADHIATDDTIKTYCQAHFGKELTIFVGPQEATIPDELQAPFLFIHGFEKSEGSNITQAQYQCMISVGIVADESNATTATGVVVYAGQQRCSELMTLVQDSLYRYKGCCQPPAVVEQMLPGITGDNLDCWQGFMIAQWDLPISIGQQNHF